MNINQWVSFFYSTSRSSICPLADCWGIPRLISVFEGATEESSFPRSEHYELGPAMYYKVFSNTRGTFRTVVKPSFNDYIVISIFAHNCTKPYASQFDTEHMNSKS